MTIDDIATKFGVSRRTAERMRTSVVNLYPDVTCRIGPDGRKIWMRPPARRLGADEILALEWAIDHAAREHRDTQARVLSALLLRFEGRGSEEEGESPIRGTAPPPL